MATGVVLDDRKIRVEDYLNDKIQTTADLESLDTLLVAVKSQQQLLKKQLEEATASAHAQRDHANTKSTLVSEEAQSFQSKQSAIDHRLLIVTSADTSAHAHERFESVVEKLNGIDVAEGYVQTLQEVEKLRNESRHGIKNSPEAALEPYTRLKYILVSLRALQPAAEGAAPHLVDHVEQACTKLWLELKSSLSAELEQVLSGLHWPNKDLKLLGSSKQGWESAVEKLLKLQEPELQAWEQASNSSEKTQEPLVLLPLEVMVRPLELRFRYHFEGDKPTNRPEKPEYFLSHILGLLNSYNNFFIESLQPLLYQRFKGSALSFISVYIDSSSALIASLLPMARAKAISAISQIRDSPQLLSHFIHELLEFDVSLRDEWGYDGGQGAEGWPGLASEVLVKNGWFGRWLGVEKDFALARYESIIDAKDAWEIDRDSLEPGATKPTRAAMRVNDLLETITDRYRPLTSFSQKLRFLIDIQIAIFDKYHQRLKAGLEAYIAATSAVVRAVQGVSKDERASVRGINGLERLCRIYGSAEYLERAMADWSDDLFFLELWDELQDRARRKAGQTIAGSLSLHEIAERTSSSVGSNELTGALFDETASAYKSLRIQAEEVMVELLTNSLKESLRPYSRINPWSSLETDDITTSSPTTSAELEPALQQLKAYFSYLSPVIGRGPKRRLSRQLCSRLQVYLWDNVLMRHTFTLNGTKQLIQDISGLWTVIDGFSGNGQAALAMGKLREALVLLSLSPDSAEDEESPLSVIETQIFADNEQARSALESLGLPILTESDSRAILERRVELAS